MKRQVRSKHLFAIWLFCIIVFFIVLAIATNSFKSTVDETEFGRSDYFLYVLASIALLGILSFGLAVLVGIVGLIRSSKFVNRSTKVLVIVSTLILACGGIIFITGNKQYRNTENNNSIDNQVEKLTCTRTERYDNLPEFDRALSLIEQRIIEATSGTEIVPTLITNCIVVSYDDLRDKNGAEGLFYFGGDGVTENHLPIFIDRSYKSSDDILTAILMTHEIAHAIQYLSHLEGKPEKDCYGKEIQAYMYQAAFIDALNAEEKNSLKARLNYFDTNNYPLIQNLKFVMDHRDEAYRVCSDSECALSALEAQISTDVYSSPYYVEQCEQQVR